MIQRVQTVYLAVGGLALLGLLPFDAVWSSEAATSFGWFKPASVGAIILTAIVAIGAIFMYNKRPKQRSLVVGVQVLTVLTMLITFGGLYFAGALQPMLATLTLASGAVLALPVLAYIFFFLARRSIDKDIALIKSMDRLR